MASAVPKKYIINLGCIIS